MKITAYKCEDTGQVFEHLKDYRTHRAKISRKLNKERLWREKEIWLQSKWQEMHNAVSTIQELEQWVTANWDIFKENYYHTAWYVKRTAKVPDLVEFKIVENRWYDGEFRCTAKLRLSHDTPSFISRFFDNGPFKTGGGGGSHANYNQYITLKADKFHVLTTRYFLTKEPL